MHINKDIVHKLKNIAQPLSTIEHLSSLEEGVTRLLELGENSQKHLTRFMNHVVRHFTDNNIEILYYNPLIKSFQSALRKAKSGGIGGVKNQIRAFDDPYRGSLILNTMANIYNVSNFIERHSEEYGFKILNKINTFDHPRPSGYRDINYKISDMRNQELVGELQIHLCTIRKFSEINHKAYEITRSLPENKKNVRKALQTVTRYGYNMVSKMKNSFCIKSLSKLYTAKQRNLKAKHKTRKNRHND